MKTSNVNSYQRQAFKGKVLIQNTIARRVTRPVYNGIVEALLPYKKATKTGNFNIYASIEDSSENCLDIPILRISIFRDMVKGNAVKIVPQIGRIKLPASTKNLNGIDSTDGLLPHEITGEEDYFEFKLEDFVKTGVETFLNASKIN